MPRLSAVTAVGLRLEPRFAFYRRLGLDLPPVDGAYVAVLIGSDVRFSLLSEELAASMRDARSPAPACGCLGLSFRCADPTEVDELAGALSAIGVRIRREPFDAPWGARCCQILDPEGSPVELFAPLP